MKISYKDTEINVNKLIGEGAYGKVYMIVDYKNKDNQDKRVYKQVDPYYDSNVNKIYDSLFLKEISIYSTINNASNLVKVDEIIICPKYSYYVMEHAGESLYDTMNKNAQYKTNMNITLVKDIISSISRCMIDVNNKFIINADIKPANIMIDRNKVLLTDWSLSRSNIDSSFMNLYEEIQTAWYRCPEQILKKNVNNYKIDVWSLGVILVEIIRNKMGLFPYLKEEEVMYTILDFIGLKRINEKWLNILKDKKYFIKRYVDKTPKVDIFFENLSNIIVDDDEREKVIDLIENMLKFDPDERFDFYDIYNHDFLGNEKLERLDILTRLNSLNYLKIDFGNICKINQWYLPARNYVVDNIKQLSKINSNNLKIISRTIKIMDIVVSRIKLDMKLINEYISIAYYLANIINGCKISRNNFISYTRVYIKLIPNEIIGLNKLNSLNEIYKSMTNALNLDMNIYTGIYYEYLLIASGFVEHIDEYYETFLRVQSHSPLISFSDESLARISIYIMKNKYSLNNDMIDRFLQNINVFEKDIVKNNIIN
jgi:male germ cell-associated kinase